MNTALCFFFSSSRSSSESISPLSSSKLSAPFNDAGGLEVRERAGEGGSDAGFGTFDTGDFCKAHYAAVSGDVGMQLSWQLYY